MQRIFILISILIVLAASSATARKTGYRLIPKKSTSTQAEVITRDGEVQESDTTEMAPGSFMVASQCENCNNGYRLDQVVFSGFDKTKNNSNESFFIINNTDRTLTAVALYIDYRTPDGRQLTRRFIRLICNIPAGETRKADIPSWDTQRSFYHIKSEKPRRGGNPFDIRFDPIAYYLQF